LTRTFVPDMVPYPSIPSSSDHAITHKFHSSPRSRTKRKFFAEMAQLGGESGGIFSFSTPLAPVPAGLDPIFAICSFRFDGMIARLDRRPASAWLLVVADDVTVDRGAPNGNETGRSGTSSSEAGVPVS